MKERIIGAIIILLVGIPFVVIGGKFFTLGCGILGALSLKEIMELKEHHGKIPNFIFFISVVDLLLVLFSSLQRDNLILELPYKYLIFTFLSLCIPTLFYKNKEYSMKDALYLFGSIVLLGLIYCSDFL